jgi:hypothetical protein
MFAQFRSQYPQGRIQTEMLSKIDGLHAFRAIVSQGDAIMGTATAVDSDLEIAEDRAIKRALTIAGITLDNAFDNSFGNYAPMLTQVSREPVNSLPSAKVTHTTHTIQSEPSMDYGREYATTQYPTTQYAPEENFHYTPNLANSSSISSPNQELIAAPIKSSAPQISPEPVDLSDAISKIDVEMERLSWTKEQGRDYLVRNFDKRARSLLTNDELLQFLSHLKTLPTPHRQAVQAVSDDFF